MFTLHFLWFTRNFSIKIKANLVLQDTIERIYVGDAYGDIPRGIFIIRGENVVLLGEIVRFSESSVFDITLLKILWN